MPQRVQSLLATDEHDDERRSAGLPPLARLSDQDRPMVQLALLAVIEALTPCPMPQTLAILARLAAHFPVASRSEAQWRLILQDYASDLEDMPADIIEAGCAAYRRAGKWWPKSAELLEHMTGPLLERRRQRKRLERLLRSDDRREADQPVSLDERSRVGVKLGDLARQIASWPKATMAARW